MTETTTEPLYYYHLNMRHMSGRVVKFRVLDVPEVELIQANAAREAGEHADMQQLRNAQLKHLTAAFLVSVSAPGQEPARVPVRGPDGNPRLDAAGQPELAIDGGAPDLEKLKGAAWTNISDAATLRRDWSKLFGTKETAALYALYRDWHEINGMELEMILGKGLPVPAGD